MRARVHSVKCYSHLQLKGGLGSGGGVAVAHKLTISQHLECLHLDLQLFSRWTWKAAYWLVVWH